MAAITIEKSPEGVCYSLPEVWEQLHYELSAHLPTYARPVFVRVQNTMALTSTFKHQKNGLVEDSYDVTKCAGDQVFMYNVKDGSFVPVTALMMKALENKQIIV